MTFPVGWAKKQKITINYTPAVQLVNFPVLITEAHLLAEVFTLAQADGRDLRFTVDAAGLTVCPYEIECFGAANTKIHVQVPTLPTTSLGIWIWYGNPTATAPGTPSAVWDSSFIAVYHLSEVGNGTAGEYKDSTANALHATGRTISPLTPPTRVAGAVRYGQQFSNATKNGIQLPASTLLCPRYSLTTEVLGAPSSLTAFLCPLASALATQFPISSTGYYRITATDGVTLAKATTAALPAGWAVGTYSHLAAVYDLQNATPVNRIGCTFNGVQQTMTDNTTPPTQFHDGVNLPANLTWAVGSALDGQSGWWDGIIDELRISSVPRSVDWLAATYATLLTPASFATPVLPSRPAAGVNFHRVAQPNSSLALGLPCQSNAFFDQLNYLVHYCTGANHVLAGGKGDATETPGDITFATQYSEATTQAASTLSAGHVICDDFDNTVLVGDLGSGLTNIEVFSPASNGTWPHINGDSFSGTHANFAPGAPSRYGSNVVYLQVYIDASFHLVLNYLNSSGLTNPQANIPYRTTVATLADASTYPQVYAAGIGNVGICLVAFDGVNYSFVEYMQAPGNLGVPGSPVTLPAAGWAPGSRVNFRMVAAWQSIWRVLLFRDSAAPNTLRACVYGGYGDPYLQFSATVTVDLIPGDYGFTGTVDVGGQRMAEQTYIYYLTSAGKLCRRILAITNTPVGRDWSAENWSFALGAETVLSDIALAPLANNLQAPLHSFRQSGVVLQDGTGWLLMYRETAMTPKVPLIDTTTTCRPVPDSTGYLANVAYSRSNAAGTKSLVSWASGVTTYANIYDHSAGAWVYPTRHRISGKYCDGHNVPLVEIDANGRLWSLMGGRQGNTSENLILMRSAKTIYDADISNLLDYSTWTACGTGFAPTRGYKQFFADHYSTPWALFFYSLSAYIARPWHDANTAWGRGIMIFAGQGANEGYPTMPMFSAGLEDVAVPRTGHVSFPFANYNLSDTYRVMQTNYLRIVPQADGMLRGYRADGGESVLPVFQTMARSGGQTTRDIYADGDILLASFSRSSMPTRPVWAASMSAILGDLVISPSGHIWSCRNIGTQIDAFPGPAVDTTIWNNATRTNPTCQTAGAGQLAISFASAGTLTSDLSTLAANSADFDLIVTLTLDTYATSPTGYHQAGIEINDGAGHYVRLVRRVSSGMIHDLQIQADTGIISQSASNKVDPPLCTRLRLRRAGGTVYVYVWNYLAVNSFCWTWEGSELGQAMTFPTGAAYVRLFATQGGTALTVHFEDLYFQNLAASYAAGAASPFPASPSYRQRVQDNQIIWQYLCPERQDLMAGSAAATPITLRNSGQIGLAYNCGQVNTFTAQARMLWTGSAWEYTYVTSSSQEISYYCNFAVNLKDTSLAANLNSPVIAPYLSASINVGQTWTSGTPVFDQTHCDTGLGAAGFCVNLNYRPASSQFLVTWSQVMGEMSAVWCADVAADWGSIFFGRTVFSDQFNGYFMGV